MLAEAGGIRSLNQKPSVLSISIKAEMNFGEEKKGRATWFRRRGRKRGIYADRSWRVVDFCFSFRRGKRPFLLSRFKDKVFLDGGVKGRLYYEGQEQRRHWIKLTKSENITVISLPPFLLPQQRDSYEPMTFFFLTPARQEAHAVLHGEDVKINPPLLINAERKWNPPLTVTSCSKGKPSSQDKDNASSAKTLCHFAGINSNSCYAALSPVNTADIVPSLNMRHIENVLHVALRADEEGSLKEAGFKCKSDSSIRGFIRGTAAY